MEPMTEANTVSPPLNNVLVWKGDSAAKKRVQRLMWLMAGFHTFKHWMSAWLTSLSRAPPDPRIPRRERSPPEGAYSPFSLD
jgi:hypothetical protein